MIDEWAEMHRVSLAVDLVAVALLALLLLGGVQYLLSVGQADTVFARPWRTDAVRGAGNVRAAAYLGGAAIAVGLLLALLARRPTIGWGFVYIALPALALLALSWWIMCWVFWVMIVTWATDIGAFFAARQSADPKLAPRFSPAKTWAGLFGGAVAAGLLGYAAARYFEIDAAPDALTGEASWLYQSFLYLGAPLAVVAQAGDLYESWVKRRCGVKDSGTILPGHGACSTAATG
jgi:phosphatidate cytidylyltransferase